MEGVSLSLRADDLRHLSGVFTAIAERGDDTTPLMDDIAAYGVQSTRLRFRGGIGPDGSPWMPSLRAKATGGQTLVDRGRLRSSITGYATRDSAQWGTNLIYAGVHQFGATIRPRTAERLAFSIPGIGFRTAEEVIIPARPFLGVNAADRAEISDLIQDHYVGGLL